MKIKEAPIAPGEIQGLGRYELEAWAYRLGATPLERVAHEDRGEMYETCQAHVLRLANGRYALVTESGCSCYDPGDANIDLHPTRKAAMAAFEKWKKENAR